MRCLLPVLLFVFFIPEFVKAQCGFTGSELIPDATTTQLSVEVTGALNNDLATAGQGVCRVNIGFQHPHIGDLSVRLHSPAGQVIILIGNIGNSANTAGSTWNVHFIPQGGTPAPDIGILPVWANTSNWQANNTYTGTYFPVSGNSLGQFNSGPVNGRWTIELTDGSNLDVGTLTSFSIEFCQPAGIACSSCFKKAGVLPDREISACEGSDDLNTGITPQFPYGNNGANTGYKYIVSTVDDKIIDLLDVIDMRSFPPGLYMVCGFAYDSGHPELLPGTDSTESLSAWKNLYFNGHPELCGDITSQCLVIRIRSVSPLQELTRYICGAGPISVEGQQITSPGVYTYNYLNRFGCDSSLRYTVLPVSFGVTLNVSNILSCTNTSAKIKTAGSLPPQTLYTWFTANGILASGTDLDSLTVSAPGTYFLALEKDGCRDTVSINVLSDISLPQITLTTTHLNCAMPARQISVSSIPANVTYEWSGPGGFSSGLPDPVVSVPGIYTVRVTKQDGCSVTGQVNVTGDFEAPHFVFIPPVKTCADELAVISIQSDADITSYQWTLPDGSASSLPSVNTSLNGKAFLLVTASNGCQYSDSIDITFLYQNPVIHVNDTIINCYHPDIQLPATAFTQNFSIQWSGPGGFFSDVLNPSVDAGGLYTGVATEPNGCTTEVEIFVDEDFARPALTISPASFGCMQDSLRINTTTTPNNVSFSWTGPKLYASAQSDPYVYETGWYHVTVTAFNGCTRSDSILVGLSSTNPRISVADDSLTCRRDSARLSVQVSAPANAVILWTGPNGYSSAETAPWVTAPGKYWVKVTNPGNDCFTNKSVIITDLTHPPAVQLFQDSINCIRTEARFGLADDPLFTDYYWILPSSDTIRNQLELTSTSVDTFDLVVENIYGCRLDTFIHTATDYSTPLIQVDDHFISCASPSVTLQASSNVSVGMIEWTFPDGSLHTESNPVTDQYGQYKVKISGSNGCPDSAYFQVLPDTVRPDVTVLGGSFSCMDQFFTLGYTTAITGGSIRWSGPGGFTSTQPQPQVSTSGYYTLTITAANGCTGVDSSLVVLSDVLPVVYMADDSITCRDNPLVIRPDVIAVGPMYEWTDDHGNIYTSDTLSVVLPGIYYLKITDQFQCIVLDTAVIAIDTARPRLILEPEYFMNCNNDSLFLKAVDLPGSYTFEWFESSSLAGLDSVLLVTEAGRYRVEVEGKNGCTTEKAFLVTTDFEKPDLTATGGQLNCDFTKIDLKASSTVTGVSYEWNIAGQVHNTGTVTVDQAGAYPVSVKALNGCVSDTIVRVDTSYTIPDLLTSDGSISCDSSNFLLSAFTATNGSSFGWFGPDNFFSPEQHVYVTDTGTYYIFLKGANGCLNVDTVHVDDDPPYPAFSLRADTITCFEPLAGIYLYSPDSLEHFSWTGPGNFTSTDKNPGVTASGYFVLTALNDYGCPTVDSVFVAEDTEAPLASFTSTDSILCAHREIVLSGNDPPPGKNYDYFWSTPDGMILSDPSDTSVLIREPGIYLLTTRDLHNGCAQTYSHIVEEKANPIDTLIADVLNVACAGLSNGQITITGVPGAIGEVRYSLIDDYYGDYNYYNKLSPGIYSVKVRDSYGCVFSQDFEVGIDDPIGVDLGNDTIIRLGELIIIQPELKLDPSEISAITWENAPADCQSCLVFEDRPEKTTVYKIRIISSEGCTDEAIKRVIVQSGDLMFIPNVFSPNGDGNNDNLEISASPGVSAINAFRVFDRWGNIVFSREHFMPGDPSAAWDGSFNGQRMNPGVFVYFVEYVLTTGEKLIIKGSVTLVR